MKQGILIWDVPTRVFHWLLVASFTGTFLTAESERYRDIHVALGYVLFGLLLFRLVWGFVGTRYAKFSSFLFKPEEVFAYALTLLKGKPAHYVGHNPLGSVAIWLLLVLGMVSSVTGVMAFEDIGGDPLVELHDMVSYAMLGVVVLHILGVIASSVMHRENLAKSMVVGRKRGEAEQGIGQGYAGLGILIFVIACMFTYYYLASGSEQASGETYQNGGQTMQADE